MHPSPVMSIFSRAANRLKPFPSESGYQTVCREHYRFIGDRLAAMIYVYAYYGTGIICEPYWFLAGGQDFLTTITATNEP